MVLVSSSGSPIREFAINKSAGFSSIKVKEANNFPAGLFFYKSSNSLFSPRILREKSKDIEPMR